MCSSSELSIKGGSIQAFSRGPLIGQACSPLIKKTTLWDSIMELGRAYDNIMGLVLFLPIGFLSWFPFVSEFQTRLLFNQAFSRGLQISRILAGQKDIGEFE